MSTVWADVVELGAGADAGAAAGASLDFDERVAAGGSAAGVFVVPVLPEVPVVLWAVTTTPSATVSDFELGALPDAAGVVEPGVAATGAVAPDVTVALGVAGVDGVSPAGLPPVSEALVEVSVESSVVLAEPAVEEFEVAEPEEVSSAAATP